MKNTIRLIPCLFLFLGLLSAFEGKAQRIDVTIEDASGKTVSDGSIILIVNCDDEPRIFTDDNNLYTDYEECMGSRYTYSWSLPDGTTSNQQNLYNKPPGQYCVTVIKESIENGNCESTTSSCYTIQGFEVDVSFDYEVADDGCTVYFTNTTQVGDMVEIDRWLWEFGDGGRDDSEDTYNTYNDAGMYTVKLTAFSGDKEASDVRTINVPCGDDYSIGEINIEGPTNVLFGATEYYTAIVDGLGLTPPIDFYWTKSSVDYPFNGNRNDQSTSIYFDPRDACGDFDNIVLSVEAIGDNGRIARGNLGISISQAELARDCSIKVEAEEGDREFKFTVRDPAIGLDPPDIFPIFFWTIEDNNGNPIQNANNVFGNKSFTYSFSENEIANGIYTVRAAGCTACAYANGDCPPSGVDCSMKINVGGVSQIQLFNEANNTEPVDLTRNDLIHVFTWDEEEVPAGLDMNACPPNKRNNFQQDDHEGVYLVDWFVKNESTGEEFMEGGSVSSNSTSGNNCVVNNYTEFFFNLRDFNIDDSDLCKSQRFTVRAEFFEASDRKIGANEDPISNCCPHTNKGVLVRSNTIVIQYEPDPLPLITLSSNDCNTITANINNDCITSLEYYWTLYDVNNPNEPLVEGLESEGGDYTRFYNRVTLNNSYLYRFSEGTTPSVIAEVSATNNISADPNKPNPQSTGPATKQVIYFSSIPRINIPDKEDDPNGEYQKYPYCFQGATELPLIEDQPIISGDLDDYIIRWSGPGAIYLTNTSIMEPNIMEFDGESMLTLTVCNRDCNPSCNESPYTVSRTIKIEGRTDIDLSSMEGGEIYACAEGNNSNYSGGTYLGPDMAQLGDEDDYIFTWTSDSGYDIDDLLSSPFVANPRVIGPSPNDDNAPEVITYTVNVIDTRTNCTKEKSVTVRNAYSTYEKTEEPEFPDAVCYGEAVTIPLGTVNMKFESETFDGQSLSDGRREFWVWTSDHPDFSEDMIRDHLAKSWLNLDEEFTKRSGVFTFTRTAQDSYSGCIVEESYQLEILPQWEYNGFKWQDFFVTHYGDFIPTWSSSPNEITIGPENPLYYVHFNATTGNTQLSGPLPFYYDKFRTASDRRQLLVVAGDAAGCREEFLSNRAKAQDNEDDFNKVKISPANQLGDRTHCDNLGFPDELMLTPNEACFIVTAQFRIPTAIFPVLPPNIKGEYEYRTIRGSSEDWYPFELEQSSVRQTPSHYIVNYRGDICDNIQEFMEKIQLSRQLPPGRLEVVLNARVNINQSDPPFYVGNGGTTNFFWFTPDHFVNTFRNHKCFREREVCEQCPTSCDAYRDEYKPNKKLKCEKDGIDSDDCDDCDFEDLAYNNNTGNFNSLQSCGSDFTNRQLNTNVDPTDEQYGSEALTHQRSQVDAKDYESVPSGAYTTGRVSDSETDGEVFVLKQDANNSTEWQQYFSSTGRGIANGIVADDQEQVVLTGLFSQSIDFGGTQLNSNAGTEDIFLTKLDIDGNVLWSKKAGGNGYDEALDIAIDDAGNTYLTGYITGAATFDNITTSTPANKRSLFLAKYDANGQAQWVRTGEASENVRESVLVSSASGEVYLANNFVGELTLEGGTTFTGNGLEESAMLTKYQTNGNVAWGKIIGQGSNVNLTAIVMDNTGQVTVAGEFDGTSSFDSEQALTTLGGTDLFFARYDGSGFQTDLQQKGGFENDYLQALATDGAGQYVFAGAVEGDDGSLDCVEEDVDDCSFAIEEGVFNATCAGNDGAIFLEVAGEESLTFEWSNNVTTADNPNLVPGDYTLIITNTEGCRDTFDYVIEGGAVEITPQVTEPTCGLENGSIYVFPSGGYPPYTYAWSNNSTGSSITNLGAGTYTVTVTDSEDCEAIETFTFDAPTPLAIDFNITDTECGQEQGSIQTTVMGGTGPYTYQWADVTDNSPNRTGLNAGSYTLTVTDSEGCEEVDIAEVENTTMPDIDDDMDDVTCKGSDGAIYLIIDGVRGTFASQEIVESNQEVLRGRNEEILASERVNMLPGFDAKTGSEFNAEIAPLDAYQITWSNGEVGRNVEGLRAGRYVATISDGEGCEVTKLFELPDIIFYTVQGEVTNADCNDATGSIDLSVLGGVEPFIYNWSNGKTTEDLSDLLPGGYEVTVIDANSCIVTQEFSVRTNNNLAIESNITSSSCGQKNGNIVLTITGAQGTPDIQWADSDEILADQTTTTATNLEAGFYSVTVSDEGGCQVTESFEVSDEDGEPLVVIIDDIEQHCDRDGGIINITASEGEGDYTYQWYRKNNPNSSEEEEVLTEEDLNVRRHGFYRVVVTDERGCTVSSKGYERLYKQLTIDPYCEGSGDGYDVRSRKKGGSSKVTYTWSKDGSILNDVGNIGYLSQTGEGFYCITVTDNRTGCPPVSGTIDVPTDCSGSTSNLNHSEVIYYTYPESGRSVEIKTNGFKGAIDIFLTNDKSEFLEIKLMNTENKTLYTEVIEVVSGENSISLQIDHMDLAEGIYQLLLVEENGEMRQFTLVKLE